jgi:hypothetical protein
MIALMQNMSRQRTRELHEAGARNRLAARSRRPETPEEAARSYGSRIVIRRLGAADAGALERVAGRDSATVPEGDLIGAEFDGRLIAALSLQTGQLVADPFSPTAAAALLLRRRAERMRGEGERGSRRAGLRGLLRSGRRPGALRS